MPMHVTKRWDYRLYRAFESRRFVSTDVSANVGIDLQSVPEREKEACRPQTSLILRLLRLLSGRHALNFLLFLLSLLLPAFGV
jgi:hypothetical protein